MASQPGLAAAAELTPSGGDSGCEPAPPALRLKLVSLLKLAERRAEGQQGLWEIQQSLRSGAAERAQKVLFPLMAAAPNVDRPLTEELVPSK